VHAQFVQIVVQRSSNVLILMALKLDVFSAIKNTRYSQYVDLIIQFAKMKIESVWPSNFCWRTNHDLFN